MDTGSGLDAFSIMEQGKIDAILAANPTERRTIFEDAEQFGEAADNAHDLALLADKVGDKAMARVMAGRAHDLYEKAGAVEQAQGSLELAASFGARGKTGAFKTQPPKKAGCGGAAAALLLVALGVAHLLLG